MAGAQDVGVIFETSSFKEFNDVLKKFNSISYKVDERLTSMSKSIEKIVTAVERFDTVQFFKSNMVSNFTKMLVSFNAEMRKLNFANLEQFSKSMSSLSFAGRGDNISKSIPQFKELILAFEGFSKLNTKGVNQVFASTSKSIGMLVDVANRFSATNTLKMLNFLNDLSRVIKAYGGMNFETVDVFFGKFSVKIVNFLQTLSKIRGTEKFAQFNEGLKSIFTSIYRMQKAPDINPNKFNSYFELIENITEKFTGFGAAKEQGKFGKFLSNKPVIGTIFKSVTEVSDIIKGSYNKLTSIVKENKGYAARIGRVAKDLTGVQTLFSTMSVLLKEVGKIGSLKLNIENFGVVFDQLEEILVRFTGKNKFFEAFRDLAGQNGLFKRMVKIRPDTFGRLVTFAQALGKFTESMNTALLREKFPSQIEIKERLTSIKELMHTLTESFTGIRGIDRIFAIGNAMRRGRGTSQWDSAGALFEGLGGISGRLATINLKDLDKINTVSQSLAKFTSTLADTVLKRDFPPISEIRLRMQSTREALHIMVETFTGIRGWNRFFAFGNAFKRGSGTSQFQTIGKLFEGLGGISGKISNLKFDGIKKLSEVSLAITRDISSLTVLMETNIDYGKLRENLKNILGIFTGVVSRNTFDRVPVLSNLKDMLTGNKSLFSSLKSVDIKDLDKLLKIANVFDKVASILEKARKVDFNETSDLSGLGKNLKSLIDSVAEGIDLTEVGAQAGKTFGKAFVAELKKELKIRSPSKVMQDIGKDVALGFNKGFSTITTIIKAPIALVVNTIKKTFSTIGGTIKTVFNKANTVIDGAFRRIISGAKGTVTGLGNIFNRVGNFAFRLNNIMDLFQRFRLDEIARAGIEFESSFAGVLKTLDLTAQEAEVLREGLRDLATDPISVVSGMENAQNVLAGIAESAGQLGIAKEDVLEFTETIGALTLATNLTSESAATELARFANIFGTSEFDRIGAALVELGNNSATTEAEIVEFAQRLAGVGKVAGFSESDILAVSAAMSSVGINAEAGGTAMTQIFDTITKQLANGEIEGFADIAGMTNEAFSEAWLSDPIAALDEFIQGFGELDNLEQVAVLDRLSIDGIRVAQVVRSLSAAENGLSYYVDLSNQGWEENIALMEEAEKRNQTVASSVNRFRNSLRDVGITIFDIVRPAIVTTVSGLTGFVNKINNFIQKNVDMLTSIVQGFTNVGANIASVVLKFGEITGHLIQMFIKSTTITDEYGNQLTIVDRIRNALVSVGDTFNNLILKTKSFADNLVIGLNALRGISPLETMAQSLEDEKTQILADIAEIRGYATRDYTGGTQQESLIKYDIQAGDTLTAIAAANGVSVADLMTANGLKDSLIIAGESLQIPTGEFISTTAPWNQEELKAEYDAYLARLTEIDDELVSISEKKTEESIISDELLEKFKTLDGYIQGIKESFDLILQGDFSGAFTNIADTIASGLGFDSQEAIDSESANPFSDRVSAWAEEFENDKNVQQNVSNALDAVVTSGIGFGLRMLIAPPLGILASIGLTLSNFIETDFLGLRSTLEQSEIGNSILDAFNFINELIDGAISSVFEAFTGTSLIQDSAQDMINLGIVTNDAYVSKKANNPFNKIIEFLQPLFDIAESLLAPVLTEGFRVLKDDIVPAIQDAFTLVTDTLDKVFGGEGGDEDGTARLNTLQTFITGLSDGIGQLAGLFVGGAGELLSGGIEIGTSWVSTLIEVFGSLLDIINALSSGNVDSALQSLGDIFTSWGNFASSGLDTIFETARNLMDSMRNIEIGGINPFALMITWVEDFVFRIQVAALDLEILMNDIRYRMSWITGDTASEGDAIQARADRVAAGLGFAADTALTRAQALGQTINLDEVVSFEFEGNLYERTLGDALSNEKMSEFIHSGQKQFLTDNVGNMITQLFEDGIDVGDFDLLRYITSFSPEEASKFDFSPYLSDISAAIMDFDNLSNDDWNLMQAFVGQAFLTDEQEKQLNDALQGVYYGMEDGFENAANESTVPTDVGTQIGQDAIDAMKDVTGTNSPSTVFYDIGGWLMQGLSDGISNKLTIPMLALQRFGYEITKTALSYSYATYGMIQDTLDLNDSMRDLVLTTTDLISKVSTLAYTMSLMPTDIRMNIQPMNVPVTTDVTPYSGSTYTSTSSTSNTVVVNAGSADAQQVARMVEQRLNNPSSNADLYRNRIIQQGGQGI